MARVAVVRRRTGSAIVWIVLRMLVRFLVVPKIGVIVAPNTVTASVYRTLWLAHPLARLAARAKTAGMMGVEAIVVLAEAGCATPERVV